MEKRRGRLRIVAQQQRQKRIHARADGRNAIDDQEQNHAGVRPRVIDRAGPNLTLTPQLAEKLNGRGGEI